MTAARDLLELLVRLETELHIASTRNSNRPSDLLADDFVEFGASGRIYDKTQVIAALQHEFPIRTDASDFQLRLLSSNSALLTYHACRFSSPPTHSLRSSIWVLERGDWRLVFHQGTVSREVEDHG